VSHREHDGGAELAECGRRVNAKVYGCDGSRGCMDALHELEGIGNAESAETVELGYYDAFRIAALDPS
jgi:hypothetical protein